MKLTGKTTIKDWLDNETVSYIKSCVLIADVTKDFTPSTDHLQDSLKYILKLKPIGIIQNEEKESDPTGSYRMKFENGSIISFGWVEKDLSAIGNSPIPKQPFIRSFSEILIDADNAKTQKDLEFYYHEFMMNRKKFPLIYKWFAEEHFKKLSLKFTK